MTLRRDKLNTRQKENKIGRPKTVYIRPDNLKAYEGLEDKSSFINWCFEKHLAAYIEERTDADGFYRSV